MARIASAAAGADAPVVRGRRDEHHWIVLLALLILLEKVTSFGRQIALISGVILVAAGAWLLLTGMS
jgi:predicted metal-binding membrane protein